MVLMSGKHDYDHPENLLYQPMNAVFNATMLNQRTADLYDKTNDVRYRGVFSWNMPQRPTAEPGSVAFMYGTNIKLNEAGMRLSEVYLMIAECHARQGNVSVAHQLPVEILPSRRAEPDALPLLTHHVDEARLRQALLVHRTEHHVLDLARQLQALLGSPDRLVRCQRTHPFLSDALPLATLYAGRCPKGSKHNNVR